MAGFRATAAEMARFLAAGLGNTLFTIGIYQATVSFTTPLIAYLVAWLVGIAIVMLAYPSLVFRRKARLRNALAMGAIYLVAFLIGCAVTALCVRLRVPDRAIILIAAAVTSGFTYFCGRRAVALAPDAGCTLPRP